MSGGVGGDGRIILVGTAKGEVLALDSAGKQVWKAQLTSEVLSAPQIEQGIVVCDGRWTHIRAATLRTVREMALSTNVARVDRADARRHCIAPRRRVRRISGGRLVALTLNAGNVGWEAAVALPKGATELSA